LDICVIIAGDPLTTMQQITSLLLHRHPDNTASEYFHGACLDITVPASVPLQLDGTTVSLKDYLSKAEIAALREVPDKAQVLVTYTFSAMPHALGVAVPRTYNDELFEHRGADEESHTHEKQMAGHVKHHEQSGDTAQTTEQQQRTAAVETLPESQVRAGETDAQSHEEPVHELREKLPEALRRFFESSRKVTVVGKAPETGGEHTYIVAGTYMKSSTGESRPTAIVVDAETTVFNRQGDRLPADAVRELREGAVIAVEGKRSKRGVIHARQMML